MPPRPLRHSMDEDRGCNRKVTAERADSLVERTGFEPSVPLAKKRRPLWPKGNAALLKTNNDGRTGPRQRPLLADCLELLVRFLRAQNSAPRDRAPTGRRLRSHAHRPRPRGSLHAAQRHRGVARRHLTVMATRLIVPGEPLGDAGWNGELP
jgi:hypothetical protein